MSKLLLAASVIASAVAYVSPVAPKRTTALAGSTLDQEVMKITGVSPLKNAPADYGFDPLGFAKVTYPALGLPVNDIERTNNLRDAELRHGRLAMLAAAGWPIAELLNPTLSKMLGAPDLLVSDGRTPSLLNGGLVQGSTPAFLAL